jgi:hypothetical protein
LLVKINQKAEKRARNEEYAKRFRRTKAAKTRKTKEQLNQCNVPGHPATCEFDTCPSYNRTATT